VLPVVVPLELLPLHLIGSANREARVQSSARAGYRGVEMRSSGIAALGFLLAVGCGGGQRVSRTCTPLVVDREHAPVCPTPASIDDGWQLDLDRRTPSRRSREYRLALWHGSDPISIDGLDYRAVIGRRWPMVMPGSAIGDMALFPAEGGLALHHTWGMLPGDHILLGTSTRRIAGGDVLWVVQTRYKRHRPYTRQHVLYAVIDGALAVVRGESPPGRAVRWSTSAGPQANTCTPTQLVDRLHHGTRLERLAALQPLHDLVADELEWSELDASLQAAVEELSTSCDRWVHQKANSVLDMAFGRDRW
jgi:hypothetical protein